MEKTTLREEIDTLLQEALSISNQIEPVVKQLQKRIANGEREFRFSFFSLGEFRVICQDKPIQTKNEELSGGVQFSNRLLLIEIPYYNNKLYSFGLLKELWHEVEHIYQVHEKNGNTDTKYDSLYDKAVSAMNMGITGLEYAFARFIYLCSTAEQDAFLNELYSELHNNPFAFFKDTEAEIYNSSQVKQITLFLINILSDLENGLYDNIAKDYGKPLSYFKSLGKKSIKRLRVKAGRIIARTRMERYETGDRY